MSLTLEEIIEHEERFRREIVERECLVAALRVLRGFAAKGETPRSMELGSFISGLVSPPSNIAIDELAVPSSPPSMLPPPPAPVAPPRYIHPELEELSRAYGSTPKIVAWAIQRIKDDFSVRDLSALLEREGRKVRNAEASVVLSRLKSQGKIEQLKPNSGPNPAIYRKPAGPAPSEPKSNDQRSISAKPARAAAETV